MNNLLPLKTRLLLVVSISLLLLYSCKPSPSRKILEEFKAVDSSLMKLEEAHKKQYQKDLDTIRQFKDAPAYADTCNQYLDLVNKTSRYIDQLRSDIIPLDSTGINTSVSYSYLIKTKKADSLYSLLMRVYRMGHLIIKSPEHAEKFNAIFSPLITYNSFPLWVDNNFKGNPTVGTLTIFASYQNDCRNSLEPVFEDVKNTLKKGGIAD